MNFKDYKIGDWIQHIFKDEIRIGEIHEITEYISYNKRATPTGETSFLVGPKDMKNVSLLNKNEYPEYFL